MQATVLLVVVLALGYCVTDITCTPGSTRTDSRDLNDRIHDLADSISDYAHSLADSLRDHTADINRQVQVTADDVVRRVTTSVDENGRTTYTYTSDGDGWGNTPRRQGYTGGQRDTYGATFQGESNNEERLAALGVTSRNRNTN